WNNNCADTLKLDHIVHIKPPLAAFTTLVNCADKYTVNFEDRSVGATTWFWDFADGTTSTQHNPVHTYARAGTYIVGLSVSNGTCTHYTARTIKIVDEKANFIADSVTCRKTPVQFTAANIDSTNIASWNWDFGDGNASLSS